jgi:uncharacterized protein (TIGR03435 family)
MDCAGLGFSGGLLAARARVARKGRKTRTIRLHMAASIFWRFPEGLFLERIMVHRGGKGAKRAQPARRNRQDKWPRAVVHAIVKRMRLLMLIALPGLLSGIMPGQAQSPQSSFEVASVRPSAHEVGPDYNNQISYSDGEFAGKNVTLRRLVAEAWHCQLSQVTGPGWLGQNEYDVMARMPAGTTRAQTELMLRALLAERFHLKEHLEPRDMRVYELETAKGGPKIQPVQAGKTEAGGSGFHFRGDMRQLADLLTIQFSIPAPENPGAPVRAGGTPIPVLDKTGLKGTYDFSVDMRPEMGTDMFAAWKRALDQLGLKIESRRGEVPVVVVDDAAKEPTAN